MATTFTHTGVCARDGKYKVVFTNNKNYPKILQKDGYTDIIFIQLINPDNEPYKGAKDDCVHTLLDMNIANESAVKAISIEALKLEFILP
jgi:hypothetical protein